MPQNGRTISPDLAIIDQLGNLELIARYVVEGFLTGLHKSPFHGFSVEFDEHRLYNPGESTRHIDWKLFARSEKLFVKKYEEETNLRCQILIDSSSSMLFPEPAYNKFRFSVYATAALLHLLKKQRDAKGITFYSDKIEEHFDARSGFAHQQLLFNRMQYRLDHPTENRTQSSTADTLHFIAEKIHKRSLVILFSDMFDNTEDTENLFNGLQHLKHKKHEVILFHVLDKEHEVDLSYTNRPYRFVDMETGNRVELFPDEVRASYSEELGRFRNELKLKCTQYHIDYVDVDMKKGYYQVLQSYLIKRKRLY